MMPRIKKVEGLLELAMELQLTVKKVQNISVDKVNNFTSMELKSRLQNLHISEAANYKKMVCFCVHHSR